MHIHCTQGKIYVVLDLYYYNSNIILHHRWSNILISCVICRVYKTTFSHCCLTFELLTIRSHRERVLYNRSVFCSLLSLMQISRSVSKVNKVESISVELMAVYRSGSAVLWMDRSHEWDGTLMHQHYSVFNMYIYFSVQQYLSYALYFLFNSVLPIF